MNHHEFYKTIYTMLPPMVFLYLGPPKAKTRIMITNWDDTEIYFVKHYDFSNGFDCKIDEVLADVEAFKKWWNSPLMEALR
jgi:hypothetical protein